MEFLFDFEEIWKKMCYYFRSSLEHFKNVVDYRFIIILALLLVFYEILRMYTYFYKAEIFTLASKWRKNKKINEYVI